MSNRKGRLARSRLTRLGLENRRRNAAGQTPAALVSYIPREGVWITVRELRCPIPELGITLRIPFGFKCDLSSSPRIAWPIIAPFELSEAAPVVHDFITRYAGRIPSEFILEHRRGAARRISRWRADLIFCRIM